MFWVHERKRGHGKWEVAWTWMPYFLAADQELIKRVDRSLTEEFKGKDSESGATEYQMHQRVIELVVSRYPIPGLKRYLESLGEVDPEGALQEIAGEEA